MNELHEHYRLLLGLDAQWQVQDVKLSLEARRVEIELAHAGGKLKCPECGNECSRHDLAPERTWRHLDTMQFESLIRARAPRCNCPACGVKTVSIPWAVPHGRFTLMFEAFAVRVLQACGNVRRAALLLRLDWDSIHGIMQRAVERGLLDRELDEVKHVGMDEKSFRRGQSYVSLLVDLDGSRVLEVAEDRTTESADLLWKTLPVDQREQVEAVSLDMWKPYAESAQRHAPQAEIVHDKFHVAKYLNEAVDEVRRQEHNALQAVGDHTLKGSRQLWLFQQSNIPQDRLADFEQLKNSDLKTSRAWGIKEMFRWFWSYQYPATARKYFGKWYGWASRCRLKPIVKVAKMLHRHLDRLVSYIRHPINNAKAEAFNSVVQHIKSSARGFRSFANYRLRILFYCGKLNLLPPPASH